MQHDQEPPQGASTEKGLFITYTLTLESVSAPDPSQPQHRSLPASHAGKEVILEAIRAGVGLGLWPRLQNCVTRQRLSQYLIRTTVQVGPEKQEKEAAL